MITPEMKNTSTYNVFVQLMISFHIRRVYFIRSIYNIVKSCIIINDLNCPAIVKTGFSISQIVILRNRNNLELIENDQTIAICSLYFHNEY